jgi:glycosyltransferase involved in cell wall biosynthesis
MPGSDKLKFVAVQTGARRGYAVPLILQQTGLLDRFYTDVAGNVGWGRWLALGSVLPGGIGSRLRKLSNRVIPPAILTLTKTFAKPNIKWFFARLLTANTPENLGRLDLKRNLELGLAAAKVGFGDATHLYLMLSEFTPIMRIAQEHGIKVVSEVYILISTNRIMEQERKNFPGWEPEPPDWNRLLSEFGFSGAPLKHVDHYLCPSQNVADDLIQNWNISAEAISVVPYGMDPEWLSCVPRPRVGRVLFVGSAELRKGIHYLAMAAEILSERGHRYEFRVAGNVNDMVRNHPLCRHLNFLGRVPRDQICNEFQHADVFVLPTLAEGSAEVTYEALAASLPLVTTAASGSVARDGIEGRIVPERDPVALADAIEMIVENRQMRNQFAKAARIRAADYTWDHYGKRLVAALTSLPK